jgi:hypothetical protein
VREVVDVEALGSDATTLPTRAVSPTWIKDYDAMPGNDPASWSGKFNTEHWLFLSAHIKDVRVGGAIVALLVACATPAAPQSRDAGIASAPVCIATIERQALECSGGTALRAGDTLRIHIDDGNPRLFVNSNASDLLFQYLGRLGAHGYHVVEQFGGEHPPYFLLVQPRSGRSVAVTGMPVLSPDASRIAAATPEWDCAESPDQRLSIWRLADSVPVREWEIAPLMCAGNGATGGWAAVDPVWRAADTLAFARVEQPSGHRREELVAWDAHAWRILY